MNHYILLLYAVLLASGFCGGTVMLLLYRRLHQELLAWSLVAISAFTAWLFLVLVVQYAHVIHGFPLPRWVASGIPSVVIGIAVYGSLWRMARFQNTGVPGFFLDLAVLPLTAWYLLILLRGLEYPRTTAFVVQEPLLFWGFGVVSTTLFLAQCGIALLHAGAEGKNETLRFYLTWLGRLLFWFSPMALVALLFGLTGILRQPSTGLLNFAVYFFWNVLSLATFIRYLNRPPALMADSSVPETFRENYGITAREGNIIELIAQGLSNQEVADRLYISLGTVRTHVYNIFQKTGARSRVDLLRLVGGFRE